MGENLERTTPVRLRLAALALAAVGIVAASCGGSTGTAAGSHRTTTPPRSGPTASSTSTTAGRNGGTTTTTTAPPSGGGPWTSAVLTISPQGLGAVRIGMTTAQAQAAAGVAFDGAGDGFSYPTSIPSGVHLYVGGSPVDCVGAASIHPGSIPQTVRTPEGFELGQPVAILLHIYGPRASVVTASTGISPGTGYLVDESGGNIFFLVDAATGTISRIDAGTHISDSNSCSG